MSISVIFLIGVATYFALIPAAIFVYAAIGVDKEEAKQEALFWPINLVLAILHFVFTVLIGGLIKCIGDASVNTGHAIHCKLEAKRALKNEKDMPNASRGSVDIADGRPGRVYIHEESDYRDWDQEYDDWKESRDREFVDKDRRWYKCD